MLKNLLKYLLILVCCSLTNFASAQWQQVSSGVTANLVDGCFVTDSIGYIISANGTVLKSTDAGNSWTQNASLSGIFTSICHVGTDTIYAGGSCIYRSDNGGASWNLITSLPYVITDLAFFKGQRGYSIVPGYFFCQWSGGTSNLENFTVYKSVDNGTTWQADILTYESTSKFQVMNDSTAFVSGGHNLISYHCSGIWNTASIKTNNRGDSWTMFLQPYGGHSCYSFINDSIGYFVQPYYNYTISKTTNGGQSLTTSYTEIDDNTIRQCKFINEIDGYLVGRNNIYVTSSNGFAWDTDYSSTDSLNFMFNSSANSLFAIGANGLIIKKEVVPSAYADTIYRVHLDYKIVDFGSIPVDSVVTKAVTIKNTGTLPLNISLASTNYFPIKFSNTGFQNNLTCSLNTFQDTTIYIQFNPTVNQSYAGNLLVTADSLTPVNVPIKGAGYYGISGTIAQDTLICVDTLNIGSDIIIKSGAKLTICAGTYVRILGKFKITVEGILEALGDSLNNIDFVAADTAALWNGIYFTNLGLTDTSKFDYCNFLFNCNAPYLDVSYGIISVNHSNFSNKKTNQRAIQLFRHVFQNNCALTIANSSIYDTKSYAISLNYCDSVSITNCNFYNNYYAIGLNSSNRIWISESNVHHNLYGSISGSANLALKKSKINDNGGGISIAGSGIIIENNEIYNNFGYYFGGLRCANNSGGAIINQNLIYNNSATTGNGGGLLIELPNNNITSPFLITNNTICNNKVNQGGKGNNLYATTNFSSSLPFNFFNNIVYNVTDSINNIAWSPAVNHEIKYNCIKQDSINIWGQNNINNDPKFVKATDSVGVMTNIGTYDWTLTESSHCINGGDSLNTYYLQAIDFASLPRIYNARVDIGAYEFQGDFAEEIDTTSNDTTNHIVDTLYTNTIYPNPSNNSITVQSHRNTLTEIILYDATKLIYRKEFSESTTINISRFSNGLYIYELRDSNGVLERGKVVKY